MRDALIESLRGVYGEARSELAFVGEYQLLVAVILSAQTTDKKVNEITPKLFSKYPGFLELSRARLASLESVLREINYYKTKARNLKAMAAAVLAEYSGEVPSTHQELLLLPGVGNKTANVVLSELGYAHALAVDTHVFRVAKRLGLSQGKNVLQVEEDLKAKFPSSSWRDLHHLLIFHGRRVCKAQRPLCGECVLAESCPSSTKD